MKPDPFSIGTLICIHFIKHLLLALAGIFFGVYDR